ncbi:MAG: hypothetical protein HQL50_11645 [Magnetococcales bacterium]|nr:hypothetical protein [Magnetococcales bacterium]
MKTFFSLLFKGFVLLIIVLAFVGAMEDDDNDEFMSEWIASPGVMGFINLDDVQSAFNNSIDLQTFQTRVNEIYEGDGVVLIRALAQQGEGDNYSLLGCEELNHDGVACQNTDDPLFELTVANSDTARLKGFGVNRLYDESWSYPPNNQWPMAMPFVTRREEEEDDTWDTSEHAQHHGYHYWYSSPGHYQNTARDRRVYRSSSSGSSGFRDQIQRNAAFENKMARTHGSRFTKSINGISSQRKNDHKIKMRSQAFKTGIAKVRSNSAWGVRMKRSSGVSRSRMGSSNKRIASRFSRSSSASSFRSSSGFIG